VLLAGLLCGAAFAWHGYHFRAAVHALERYDFEGAQHHLQSCLQVWPADGEVQFLAARTARRRGAMAEAEDHLTACRRLHFPPDAVALEGVLASVQGGDLGDSEQSLRELLRQYHPDAPFILEALAAGYSRTNRHQDAINCLTQLLQRQSAHVPALLARAHSCFQLFRAEAAVEDLQRAVELAPERDDARLLLATTLAFLGQVSEAAGQYECLRRRRPDDAEVLVGLAVCRQDQSQFEEARAVLDDLLARHPDDEGGLIERGRVALRLGDAEAGERWARRAVERDPHNSRAPLVLALCLEAQGNHGEAARYRERADQLEADASGISVLTRLLAESPRDPGLHCRLGGMLLRLGREEEGVQELRTALRYDVEYRPAHRALAAYYEQTRQLELAARHRQAAVGRP
jgi:tetratricopeptide (TPR) repeat protein